MSKTGKIENSREKIIDVLQSIVDPELKFNLIDLGLIYGITIKNDDLAIIEMTLTTPACPFGDYLKNQVVQKMAQKGYRASINWVWSPLWNPEMATDEIKDRFGLW